MIAIFIFIILLLLIILDISKILPVTNKLLATIYLLIFSHIIGFCILLYQFFRQYNLPIFNYTILISALIIFNIYFILRVNLHIAVSKVNLKLRIKVMMGGRNILLLALLDFLLQIPFYLYIFQFYKKYNLSSLIIISDLMFAVLIIFTISLNGIIRIFLTSKHLRIMKRFLLLLTLWIPVLNLILLLYVCMLVKKEFKNEILKAEIQNVREESRICKTRYPLVMIHGIGFRDLKFFNYWGRIPKVLKQNGAVIYYGNHHAWGTIENNAKEIKEKIISIITEKKYEKVNIIAHSKGGLDARYLICRLEMEKYIASLTTISTPHRGSELIIFLNNRLKEKNYKRISSLIDLYAKILGDSSPECYASSQQLHPEYLKEFNRNIPDSPKVYYQSYAGVMKNFNADKLLSIPYMIMKWMKGENDGLISVESSKWGDFKGCLSDKTEHGLSHGDMVDLKRKDYNKFNIIEEYIKIVSGLKDMGF